MHIIAISDLHGSMRYWTALQDTLKKADALFVAGDLTTFGDVQAAKAIVENLLALPVPVFAVSGNCDYPDIAPYLHEKQIGVENTPRQWHDLIIAGMGGSLPAPAHTPNEISEEEITRRLQNLPESNSLILISHQPPYETCTDRVISGAHVGSRSLRLWLEKRQPLACICGHIHESRAIDRIGKTLVVNPGSFASGFYARLVVRNSQIQAELMHWH